MADHHRPRYRGGAAYNDEASDDSSNDGGAPTDDLQVLLDSMRLGQNNGNGVPQLEELAAAMQAKLKLDLAPASYLSMAETMLKSMSIKDEQAEQQRDSSYYPKDDDDDESVHSLLDDHGNRSDGKQRHRMRGRSPARRGSPFRRQQPAAADSNNSSSSWRRPGRPLSQPRSGGGSGGRPGAAAPLRRPRPLTPVRNMWKGATSRKASNNMAADSTTVPPPAGATTTTTVPEKKARNRSASPMARFTPLRKWGSRGTTGATASLKQPPTMMHEEKKEAEETVAMDDFTNDDMNLMASSHMRMATPAVPVASVSPKTQQESVRTQGDKGDKAVSSPPRTGTSSRCSSPAPNQTRRAAIPMSPKPQPADHSEDDDQTHPRSRCNSPFRYPSRPGMPEDEVQIDVDEVTGSIETASVDVLGGRVKNPPVRARSMTPSSRRHHPTANSGDDDDSVGSEQPVFSRSRSKSPYRPVPFPTVKPSTTPVVDNTDKSWKTPLLRTMEPTTVHKTGIGKARRKGHTPPLVQQAAAASAASARAASAFEQQPSPNNSFAAAAAHSFEGVLPKSDVQFNLGQKPKSPGNRHHRPPFRKRPSKTTPPAATFTSPPGGASQPIFTPTTDGSDTDRELSPMDVDTEDEKPRANPFFVVPPSPAAAAAPSASAPIQFNMGVASSSPRKLHHHPPRRPSHQETRRRGSQFAANAVPPTVPTVAVDDKTEPPMIPESQTDTTCPSSAATSPGVDSNGSTSSPATDVAVDNLSIQTPAQTELIESLREEGRSSYMDGDYRQSIERYTKAIGILRYDGAFAASRQDTTLPVILSNRAAALLMVGGYKAAVDDCEDAISHVSNMLSSMSRQEKISGGDSSGGPISLQCKLYTRMARALLKQGDHKHSLEAFNEAIVMANEAVALNNLEVQGGTPQFEQNEVVLNSAITEATVGKNEAERLQSLRDNITRLERQTMGLLSENKISAEALGLLDLALKIAPGCMTLYESKVRCLMLMHRWREVAGVCERVAAMHVKLDGCFVGDIEMKHPFLGVPLARYLTADFFESGEDEFANSELKLSSRSIVEAVLRLPYLLLPHYLRALRLEERYPAAEQALTKLESLATTGTLLLDADTLRTTHLAWLTRERYKLNRTKKGREFGDELFRRSDFTQSASQYAAVMSIDGEGLRSAGDTKNAGGRLHAVLHCNRAACLMAERRFNDALADCTAALRIHSRYMKAMLRKSRCFMRLQRYQEAILEYRRYLELVEEARNNPRAASVLVTPCLFDGPGEVTDADVQQVKRELDEVVQTKRRAEAAAREEETRRQQRQQRWQESFSGSASFNGDARQRRDWFNEQNGSRAWDQFSGRRPNESNSRQQQQQQQQHNSRPGHRRANSTGSPGSDLSKSHYTVLEIAQTATVAQIKRAYKRAALKYHPDKNSDAEAADRFRRIKLAYEVLMDPGQRREHDQSLRPARPARYGGW